MIAIGRIVVVAIAVSGGVLTSQSPEFAQQYRQRLGGAVDELARVVSNFERDAARSNMTVEEALQNFEKSGETLLADRGVTITRAFERFERLEMQRERLETAPPITRPVEMLWRADRELMQRAWEDYEPALPLTAAGLVYAGAGFLAGLLFAGFGRALLGRLFGRRKPKAA